MSSSRADDDTVDVSDQVAAAVMATPGVAGLHGGAFGEVATYLPGRRVSGVRMLDQGCEIHLVLHSWAPVHDTCQAVRDRLDPLVTGPVDVTVEDVAESEEPAHP